MALPCVRLGAARLRSGDVYRFLCRSSSHQAAAATEEIDIPRKKTWDKTAVLQALAYTVNHDPTTLGYKFKDDPYLMPKSSADYKIYLMSKEYGKFAANYILQTHPNFFEKDIAEPHIPCLMPESVQAMIEEISEEALKERIQLRRIKDSVNMYDQLLQSGTPPSLETTNRLLDLLCFYGDKEPTQESPESLDQENENAKDQKNLRFRKEPETWRKDNNAERIFNLMPEKDEHSYRTMIRGMVKHQASNKAFDMYIDLLNNRLTGDVHTFNALISAVPKIKSDQKQIWVLVEDLLNQMVRQNVQPNLHTFNAVLKSLIRTNLKVIAVQTLHEMKALSIEPSLATFFHMLGVLYRPTNSSAQAALLHDILEMIQGKSFTAQDPEDVRFFPEAMRVCYEAKDLELAYKLDALKNTGDNEKLLGQRSYENLYYGKFFSTLCMLENIDTVLKWYRENIPSRYFPKVQAIMDLLQVVEMENRLDLIPQIWKDIYLTGHTNKDILIQEFLTIMTRGKNNPELQEEFANIAQSIRGLYDGSVYSSQLKWSAPILGGVIILLCRAGRMEDVWEMLKYVKSHNLIPEPNVMEEVLDSVKATGNASAAIDLVQMAVTYSLPNTAKLANTALHHFILTEEQRITLQDLTQSSTTTSSSSSSSDRDQE